MSWKMIWAAAGAVALATAAYAQPVTLQNAPATAPVTRPAAPATRPAAPAATPAVVAPAPNSESVVAIVNDEVISTYDVRQRAMLLLVRSNIDATAENVERVKARALQDLVDERLQLQETRGDPYHITISDAEVDRRLNDIAASNHITLAQFTERLAQAGVGIGTLRNQVRADVAWNRLMGGLYGQRIRVSDTEVRDTLARIAANASSTHYLVSEIFLPASSPQEFAQMQDGGMRLLEQIGQCRCFPNVARQFSAAPSAANGGDIGWVAANELPAELSVVVQHLEPSQVSLPIRTPTGVYIVALRDKQEGQPQGATVMLTLREVTAPTVRRPALERIQRRTNGCSTLDHDIASIPGAQSIDLGQTSEADLSPEIRTRIAGVTGGAASPVQVSGDQVSTIVVCSRDTGGAGMPSRQDIESRLFDQELGMLSERYLRNLRNDATIIYR